MRDEGPRLVVIDATELEERIAAAVRRVLAEQGAAEGPRPPSVWVDVAGAAELLGIGERTVRKYARSEKLTGTRVGKLWRFRRADVLALLGKNAAD